MPDLEDTMTAIHNRHKTRDGLARLAFRLDATASGTMGAAFVVGASALDDILGIPAGWLAGLGGFLVAFAASLLWIAARTRIPTKPAWTVVLGNVAWALASVAAIAAGWFPFTAAGAAIVVAQAIAVAAFIDLQYLGLRRMRAAQ
jgi:hypothetical protein